MIWADYGTCWLVAYDCYLASIVRGVIDPAIYHWRVSRFGMVADWDRTKSLQSAKEACEQKIRELISENLSGLTSDGKL